jgi:hypothetical protein
MMQTVAERAAEYAQQIIYKDHEIKRLRKVLLELRDKPDLDDLDAVNLINSVLQ